MRIHFSTKLLASALLALSLGLTGCLTESDDKKANTPVPVTTRSLTAGAETNTSFGSAIDLDIFQSFMIDTAKTIASQIDLIFAYSGSATSAAIYSPDTAKTGIGGGDGFNFLSDFTPTNNTELKTVTGVTMASITTKAQVDSLWAAGTASANGRILLSAGTTFLAKSNLDLVVLVKVDSITGTTSNSAGYLSGTAKF